MLEPRNETPPDVGASEGAKIESLGGVSGNDSTSPDVDARLLRRYRLHTQIKRILTLDARRIASDQYPWKIHRTTACTWVQVANSVTVQRSNETGKHHFKGLATCGSVWVCPICSSRIQERRRLEVVQAILTMDSVGLQPFMVSYTFPHRVGQSLNVLLGLQQRAIKSMRETRAYKSLMATLGYGGRIRSLEVTHGLNGWHPHTHELLFLSSGVDAQKLRDSLAALWTKACRRVGLFRPEIHCAIAFLEHGVDVQEADKSVGAYLAKLDDQSKWGMSHEVTKSSSKQGRRTGRHPFELVEALPDSFIEYVHAMKGQQQIVWSRGLKAQCKLQEKTDEDLATESVESGVLAFYLPSGSWAWVTGNDARAEVLEAANRGGAPEVIRYLESLGWRDGVVQGEPL